MVHVVLKSGRRVDLRNNYGPLSAVQEKHSGPWSKELVRAIALDIGNAVVHHIETMYPSALIAVPSTFQLSVRNCVHNEIMAVIEVNDEGQIVARLRDRKQHRRKIKAAYKKIRRGENASA